MNKVKTYLIQLILALVLLISSCNNSNIGNNKAIYSDAVKSVSFIDNKYLIDTSVIQNNLNLLSLLEQLDNSTLETHNNTKEIPTYIKTFLINFTNDTFAIANPLDKWQATDCVINEENLPKRKLVYLGVNDSLVLFGYLAGGVGVSEHILIFKHKDNRVLDFWSGTIYPEAENKDTIINTIRENPEKSVYTCFGFL